MSSDPARVAQPLRRPARRAQRDGEHEHERRAEHEREVERLAAQQRRARVDVPRLVDRVPQRAHHAARGRDQQQRPRPGRAGPCCRARRRPCAPAARGRPPARAARSRTPPARRAGGSPRPRRTARSRRPAASPAARTTAPRRTRSAPRRGGPGRRRTPRTRARARAGLRRRSAARSPRRMMTSPGNPGDGLRAITTGERACARPTMVAMDELPAPTRARASGAGSAASAPGWRALGCSGRPVRGCVRARRAARGPRRRSSTPPLADPAGRERGRRRGRQRGIVLLAQACGALLGLATLAGAGAAATVFGFGWVVVALAGAMLVGTLAGWARLGPAWALLPIGALVLPSVALAVGGVRVEPSTPSVTSRRGLSRTCASTRAAWPLDGRPAPDGAADPGRSR